MAITVDSLSVNYSCTLGQDQPVITPQTLSRGLQERREYVSSELLNVCSQTVRPRILCTGASSLREAEMALPQIMRAAGEFLVLDSNRERTEALRSECTGVHFIDGDAFSARKAELGTFHFIYALNLLNEVPDLSASRVVTRLSMLLRRGGRLLLTNFSPAAMDCVPALQRMFARDEEQMARLCHGIPHQHLTGHATWRDNSESMIYLEIHG